MREPDVWESPAKLALSAKCPHAGNVSRSAATLPAERKVKNVRNRMG